MFTRGTGIAELVKRFFDIGLDRRDGLKIKGLRLPSFNIVDDFGCFLALAEVDKIPGEIIWVTVLDEL